MATEKPNVHEARLRIFQMVADLLYDLSDGDDLTPEESREFKDAMVDATEIIFEVLDLKVISVDEDDRATISVFFPPEG